MKSLEGKDPIEDLETESMFWDVATKAKNNGMSVPLYLETHGWEQDDIEKFQGSPEYQARLDAMKMIGEGTSPSVQNNQNLRDKNLQKK